MKKTLLSLALMAVAAIPAFGQNNACPAAKDCAPKACPEAKAKCDKQKPDCCLPCFDGLNLTDAQKTKNRDLRDNLRKENKCEAREARQACDSVRKACMAEKKENRVKYLSDLKQILTPDQYVKFLENNFINQTPGRKPQALKAAKVGKAGKDGRKPNFRKDERRK